MQLDLKYRPQTFDDLLGQSVVARYLARLIQQDEPRHMILHGHFGSGKTSAARIYARALNCLEITPKGSPCNECANCRESLSGSADFLEISGAEWGKKADIRQLKDKARLPAWTRRHVVAIDECHALSKEAWDVLLKVLEEPLSFLVFIFATTEIGEINPAVRSRCQALEFNLLDPATGLTYLQVIAARESIVCERSALELIAYQSRGHPRDLLKNLEQATFLGDVTFENTRALFSLEYVALLPAIWRALLANDAAALRAALQAWPADPAAILNTWREFLLFLLSREGRHASLETDPMFARIPHVEIVEIVRGLTERAAAAALSLEHALLGLMGMWDTISVAVLLQLELRLVELADLVNSPSFASVRSRVPVHRASA
jgi:DNA polymerase-3 subunit gamma/tau